MRSAGDALLGLGTTRTFLESGIDSVCSARCFDRPMGKAFANEHHCRSIRGLSELGLPWPLRVGINTTSPGAGFQFLAYWDSHSFTTSGHLWLEMDEERWVLPPGSIFFIRKDSVCRFAPQGDEPVVIRSIDWIGAPVPPVLRRVGRVARLAEACRSHDQLLQWYPKGEEIAPFRVCAVACEWMAAIEPTLKPERKSTEAAEALVNRAVQAMGARMQSGVTIGELARMCACGPSTLARAFQKVRGVTPMEVMAELQLRRAKELLLRTDYKLAHVARECGFAQEKYFSRWFSKLGGQPPGAWRATHAKDGS